MKNSAPKASIPTQPVPMSPRPVRVDSAGHLFEMSGEPFVLDGPEPEAVLEGLANLEARRMVPLPQIIADQEMKFEELRNEIQIGIDQADRGELAPFDVQRTLMKVRNRRGHSNGGA